MGAFSNGFFGVLGAMGAVFTVILVLSALNIAPPHDSHGRLLVQCIDQGAQ